MRPLLFLSGVLLAAALSSSDAAVGGVRVGGWRAIKDLSKPKVQEIARFAVLEHNKEANTILKLSRVVHGETQVVAGTNYRLVISATDGAYGPAGEYEAVVWDKPWEKFRKLTSFTRLKP